MDKELEKAQKQYEEMYRAIYKKIKKHEYFPQLVMWQQYVGRDWTVEAMLQEVRRTRGR